MTLPQTETLPNDFNPLQEDLADRVILVTGCGDGIGKETAKVLASRGATVIMLGRSIPKLEAVYDEIEATGAPLPVIQPFNLEGAAPSDYDQLISDIETNLGHLDGIVHNAAQLGSITPIENYDLELWYKVMQVNINAPFMLTRAAIPLMRQSADASVVFLSDKVGRKGKAYWGAYGVSKFSIEGFSQMLADELESSGVIRVNTYDPGSVRTRMRRQAFPGEDSSKLPAPSEVIDTILYLTGPSSKGISGKAFVR